MTLLVIGCPRSGPDPLSCDGGPFETPKTSPPGPLPLVWTPSGWQWVPALLAVWLLYELIRAAAVQAFRRGSEERVDRFLREHRIPTDPFRHTHRVVVREMVLSEPGLVEAMAKRARADGVSVAEVRHTVRDWLDEIVPQFNILAYYRVGYALARTAAYSVYNVRLDQASLDRAKAKIPDGAAVVYVSNHRSNADFVVTGFMLSKSVQVSYAVGEWARVWPLERLFRSFGSYFVRRGEKDPLYHRTLESYIQLITKQAVTQAMFPEGGLTRDGRLRPVKLGLLDHMARAKLDPTFTAPVVFVPVGINFDRVLEDENMVAEWRHGGRRPRRTAWQKTKRLASLGARSVVGAPINLFRLATGRLKKHGVCAIHFGEPVVLDDWLKEEASRGGPVLEIEDRRKRQARLQPFGDELLRRIGGCIPVTPVSLLCLAMTRIGADRMVAGVDRGDMVMALRAAISELEAAEAPFFTGDPYRRRESQRRRMSKAPQGREELVGVTLGFDETEDLDEVLERGLDVMAKRRLLAHDGGVYRSDRARWDLVRYYAHSLSGHLDVPTDDATAPGPNATDASTPTASGA